MKTAEQAHQDKAQELARKKEQGTALPLNDRAVSAAITRKK